MTGQVWPTALKTVAIKHPVNIDTPLTVHTVCVEVDVEYCLPLLNETRLHLLICFFFLFALMLPWERVMLSVCIG